MKLQNIILYCSFLAAGQAQYAGVCPEKDGQIEEINPGYNVKYKCGWLGPHGGNTFPNINTPQACAQLCQDKPDCTGSSWQSVQKKCVLSGSQNGQARANVLWMEVVESEDPFPEDTEDNNPFPEEDCASEVEACQEQNAACQEQNAACQQQKNAWSKKQNALDQCPRRDGKTFKQGGITYKVHCFKRGKGFSDYQMTEHGFTDCLNACSSDSQCKAVHYIINSSQPCKMLGQISHTQEPEHSSSPQIALIPTTPK
ncbi:uncharacterized protein N7446_005070 [Penicillium canescens]|uniref:Apple domain-containing protein n=1 Tax=Penicillium canescens TaxID=5083 RepID=A0AAD6IA60_PENCN|nr:uncharacterized protein N7446_005070 [Penicillium canescens]KAJ6038260.1 hypothetical protein N7460_008031 [Penicillium canescens]KAJ6039620.1 hypothetical protein N7444_008525 [Penicillium canescens]KAJ6068033.1 hypothetical protein N7446_005070 [Penicillium canescens]